MSAPRNESCLIAPIAAPKQVPAIAMPVCCSSLAQRIAQIVAIPNAAQHAEARAAFTEGCLTRSIPLSYPPAEAGCHGEG
jgi:hypothetical protein